MKEQREAKSSGRWPSFTPEEQRRQKLRKLYNISPEQYDTMLVKQKGRCALCGTNDPGSKSIVKNMMVDHDHHTGAVRGLLCATCNMWLGNYQRLVARVSESAIARYLQGSEHTP